MEKRSITATHLKIIALICMTIDHAARIIGQPGLTIIAPYAPVTVTYLSITAMKCIGRIAFPLFAFVISESASKTRSVPRYIGRLVLFAIVSEPVYWYAMNNQGQTKTIAEFWGHLLEFNFSNVFWTFALAVSAIFAHQLAKRKNTWKSFLLFAIVFFVVVCMGEFWKCEYGMSGIILVVALYLAKTISQKKAIIVLWAVALYIFGQVYNGRGFNWYQLSISSVAQGLCATLSCVFIARYNGKRGQPIKWLFYVYYPAHLTLLLTIKQLLTGA